MTDDKPQGPAPRRDTYGLPMFLGAWIGANAQWAGLQWPDFGFVAFLTAVVLILWLAAAFNRR